MRAKNITRYTYAKTAFQGWRLSIARQGQQFTKYFSDKQYSQDCRKSFRAAIDMRETIIKELKGTSKSPAEVFEQYRAS